MGTGDASLDGTLTRTKELTTHPGWDATNGNMVNALIAVFATGNFQFHGRSGEGCYSFLADFIIAADEDGKPSSCCQLDAEFHLLGAV